MTNLNTQPLAERMRPTTIADYYGVDKLFSNYPFLKIMYEKHFFRSAIFYGPSGSGKTTFALLLVQNAQLPVYKLNAVTCNKQELMEVITASKTQPVVLVLDEIHRLNKDKQELLLPVLESGAVILFGMTTVHPYSSVPASIRSRVNIYHFPELETDVIEQTLASALTQDSLLSETNKQVDKDVLSTLATAASGDIRFAMNTLEQLVLSTEEQHITLATVSTLEQQTHLSVDATKNHYDLLSALQKSIRGSDADAALYWLIRLSENQDVMEIGRRLLVIAYEDVALGFPTACDRVVNAVQAAEKVGFPEAIYPLGYITVELALSPKSRTITNAIAATRQLVAQHGNLPIPEVLKLRTIDRTQFYDYNNAHSWEQISYLPEDIQTATVFDFSQEHRSGKFEKQIATQYEKLRQKKNPK